MINPYNDSAFCAYADWALSQEIAWDEEQEELEERQARWRWELKSNVRAELSATILLKS